MTEPLLRELAPQVLAAVARRHGRFDLAEEATQEALVAAAQQWPVEGVPVNPRGWLIAVATRRLIDALRAEASRTRREEVALAQEPPPGAEVADEDDTLTVLFLCCHPALSPPSQLALTLRAVGGLTTAQIAAAFLVPEATMAQRISRAKATLADAGGRFELPADDQRAARLGVVLHVLYLMFNEGYTATSGERLQRRELAREAVRLTRMTHALMPEDGEVAGLLALMLLTQARSGARERPDGTLIPLAEQDRLSWDSCAAGAGSAADPGDAIARTTWPLSAAGGDRCRPCRGSDRSRYRLAAGAQAVRPAARAGAEPGRHAQPSGRSRHGRRSARRAGGPRRAVRRPPPRVAAPTRVGPRASVRDGRRHCRPR